jgi:hypothetical protein
MENNYLKKLKETAQLTIELDLGYMVFSPEFILELVEELEGLQSLANEQHD